MANLVTLSGGFVCDWDVVTKLIDLEMRDVKLTLNRDQELEIPPGSGLTFEEWRYLWANRREVERVVLYQADDSHL
jgi:hypothetical protein